MLTTLRLALIGFLVSATVAHAGLITDTVEQTVKLSQSQYFSYEHDLTDDGFVFGTATSGSISLDLWDDKDKRGNKEEVTMVFTDNWRSTDTFGYTEFANDFDANLQLKALASINDDGILKVTVVSLLGDFFVGDSVLSVWTEVPEPGTAALLLMGVAGLIVARRRKA